MVYKPEDTDLEERRNFVNWHFQFVHDGQIDATLLPFSDEYVNSLNIRFTVFPELIQEILFHYVKVVMWCILGENRTFGYIFTEPQRKTQYDTTFITPSITGESIFSIHF